MANRINQDAKATRPLWIIAISLLTIAVCLVLSVVKQHFLDSDKALAPVTVAVEEADTQPTYSPRNQPVRFRPAPSYQTSTELNETLTVAESAEAGSLLLSGTHAPPSGAGGVLAASALLQGTNYTAAIVGRVVLSGAPAHEKPIDMSDFPPCANLYSNPPSTRNFLVGQDGGLADVFVSIITGLDRKPYQPPSTDHEITFDSCRVQPYLSAALIGQRLRFKNADSNDHKLQLAQGHLSPFLTYSLKPESGFTAPEKMLRHESLLKIKCEVHSWETARLFIVGHPFFAVTDTNGFFAIPNVPPGEYRLRAMHLTPQNTNTTIREVSVRPDSIAQVHLTFDAPRD